LRLDPQDEGAHSELGMVLGRQGDWDGDAAEQREAIRLNPTDNSAHQELQLALLRGKKRR